MHRPKSITIISWFLIILCTVNVLFMLGGSWGVAMAPLMTGVNPGKIQYAPLFGMGLTIVCAIFMLRGANWSRWVYLAWVGIGTIALAFMAKSLIVFIPGAAKTIIFGYFLLRHDATQFFRASRQIESNSDADAA